MLYKLSLDTVTVRWCFLISFSFAGGITLFAVITLVLDSFKIGYYIDFSNCLSPTEGIFPITHAVHTILQVKVSGCYFILYLYFLARIFIFSLSVDFTVTSKHITGYFWRLNSCAYVSFLCVNAGFATWNCSAIKFKKCSPIVEVAFFFFFKLSYI